MKKTSKQKTGRRYTKAERVKILDAFKSSGLSLNRFSTQRDISTSTLRNWLIKSQKLGKTETAKKFLPVRILSETRVGGGPSPARSFGIELKSGRRLHVPFDFDPQEVRLLVGILEETC
jgi:transposase-like protein